MQLQLLHRTRYRFSRPLTDAIQLLRLTPLSCATQTVLDWRIDVDCNARLREARDGYGNVVHTLYINEPVTDFAITATGKVITEDRAGVVEGLPGELPPDVFLRSTSLTEPDDALRQLAREFLQQSQPPLDLLHALNLTLKEQLTFDVEATGAYTPAAQSYAERRGVCQDFAHIFIAVARLMGVPARYVSGHLFRRDGCSEQQAGHAWAEAWVPTLGWVAFDPTHGICSDDAYVRVAHGLDYSDTAPIAGARRGGGGEVMAVEVVVRETTLRSQRPITPQDQRGPF
jgi:transglutaminase-like putative cysteine protease